MNDFSSFAVREAEDDLHKGADRERQAFNSLPREPASKIDAAPAQRDDDDHGTYEGSKPERSNRGKLGTHES
jgi:hypothetical protein